jgi:hypothetical protein
MGAGRCGSTFVMNRLNECSKTNIFGEDMGATLCLLNLLFRLDNRINHIRNHPSITHSIKAVSSELIRCQLSKKSSYIGNEFYHDLQFHNNIKASAEKCLVECFSSKITGFKEIRWDLFPDLCFLNVLSSYYSRVVYVNLTRSIDQIIASSIRAFSESGNEQVKQQIESRILAKQNIIRKFLKNQNPADVVSGDVTKDSSEVMDRITNIVYGTPFN